MKNLFKIGLVGVAFALAMIASADKVRAGGPEPWIPWPGPTIHPDCSVHSTQLCEIRHGQRIYGKSH